MQAAAARQAVSAARRQAAAAVQCEPAKQARGSPRCCGALDYGQAPAAAQQGPRFTAASPPWLQVSSIGWVASHATIRCYGKRASAGAGASFIPALPPAATASPAAATAVCRVRRPTNLENLGSQAIDQGWSITNPATMGRGPVLSNAAAAVLLALGLLWPRPSLGRSGPAAGSQAGAAGALLRAWGAPATATGAAPPPALPGGAPSQQQPRDSAPLLLEQLPLNATALRQQLDGSNGRVPIVFIPPLGGVQLEMRLDWCATAAHLSRCFGYAAACLCRMPLLLPHYSNCGSVPHSWRSSSCTPRHAGPRYPTGGAPAPPLAAGAWPGSTCYPCCRGASTAGQTASGEQAPAAVPAAGALRLLGRQLPVRSCHCCFRHQLCTQVAKASLLHPSCRSLPPSKLPPPSRPTNPLHIITPAGWSATAARTAAPFQALRSGRSRALRAAWGLPPTSLAALERHLGPWRTRWSSWGGAAAETCGRACTTGGEGKE